MCVTNGGWAFMAPLGMIVMVGFWALVIWAGVHFYRSWSAHPSRRAEETLARRFAAGEIDEHEYRDRLDTLRHETAGATWGSLV